MPQGPASRAPGRRATPSVQAIWAKGPKGLIPASPVRQAPESTGPLYPVYTEVQITSTATFALIFSGGVAAYTFLVSLVIMFKVTNSCHA